MIITTPSVGFARFTTTVAMIGLLAKPGVSAPVPPAAPPFHVVATPTYTVECTMADYYSLPQMGVRRWTIAAASAAKSPGQRNVSSTITVNGSRIGATVGVDLSEQARPVIYHIAPTDQKPEHDVAVRLSYTATLIKRRLVPGAPTAAAPHLLDNDAKLFTSPSPTLDFNQSPFKAWLVSKGLQRKPTERDIQYARRVYDAIRANYRYVLVEDQDRRASRICTVNWSDCGGLCGLFVSALRASGIPARMLVGWTAKPNSPRGHPHVRCEFFADGVGWVPVEMSAAVFAKSRPASLSFGYDAGDFITLHIDPDMVIDTKGPSGIIHCPGLQTPAHSFEGDGTLNGASESITWTVRKLK